jgi:topoisomerase-4 subunit A
MSEAEQWQPAVLEEVVGDRFGRYSKYIIQERAIPDVRDGLKPVQRRILYAMYESGNHPDKPYRKSAKTIGDVMGNYHPHGDSSIYDGMVRMAQPWKMGHTLIDGHGNWGSQDDDPAAAPRYTEARLSGIAMEVLRDIDKRTVPFTDNFDNTSKEPVVLPARYPNLLVNGASGISAGFATEIPPHNLAEVTEAAIAYLRNPGLSLDELMKLVPGPDFPTGGVVMGAEGIRKAYETGRGRVYVRAKVEKVAVRGGREQLVITEIPYQVIKVKLVTAMENLRVEKKVDGIAEVRDESGREGLRIVVELKKEADSEQVLQYLLKKTDLQVAYNFNMVAIVNKAPATLGLRAMLAAYTAHQKDVVSARIQYELDKAEDRVHVVEGLVKALNILDAVIATIKGSKNKKDAQENLVRLYEFTERQAEAILMLQLYRLTSLEITVLTRELAELMGKIMSYRNILGDDKELVALIVKELRAVKKTYGVARRSVLQDEVEEINIDMKALIPAEEVIVSLSQRGYIKRTSKMSFTRSGGDLLSSGVIEGDAIAQTLDVNTVDQLLIFTRKGQFFQVSVHNIPDYRWKEAGTAVVNVIKMAEDDQIVQMWQLPSGLSPEQVQLWSLVFVTAGGKVKRTALAEYNTTRTGGMAALKLAAGDELLGAWVSYGSDELLLVTAGGMAIRFSETEVSSMGRSAGGVRGIQLAPDDRVIAAAILTASDVDSGELLVVSDAAYAKRTSLADYTAQARGGKGVQTFTFKESKRTKPNGTRLVYALATGEHLDHGTLRARTAAGTTLALSLESAPREARNAHGKPLATVTTQDPLVTVTKV